MSAREAADDTDACPASDRVTQTPRFPVVSLPATHPPFTRLRGLDGIRAIAVAAVVAYHLGLAAVPGGFLGVEIFFVVSGYLITATLVHEWQGARRIRLSRFWLRRARRLLPALFLLLLATLAVASIAYSSEVARLRTDAVAAVVYVMNWHLVFGEQPYFETVGRPSALLHLWSLAIEEQFYLFWPPLLAVALALGGRALAGAVASLGIVVSVVLAFMLLGSGGDLSRLYYGTDTRAAGLLLGAALALVFIPHPGVVAETTAAGFDRVFSLARGHAERRRAIAHDSAAGAALGVLIVSFAVMDAESALPAGLLLVDVATLVLIAAVVAPAARIVPAMLETSFMRWLGTRSYAVYLWHWPVIVFTVPGVDVPFSDPLLLAVRLLLTGFLAEVSFRFVERPIRQGALGRIRVELASRGASPSTRRSLRLRAAGAASASVVIVALLVSVALASPPAAPSEVPVAVVDGVVTPPPATPRPTATGPTPTIPAAGRTGAPTATPAPTVGTRRVTAFGESVAIAAAPALARAIGSYELDAEIGRQAAEHLESIRRRVDDGTIGDVVILAIGNNGPIWSHQGEELMDILRDVPVVVWVNVSIAREWETHNNRLIRHFARRFANVRIVDWHAASSGRTDLFTPDMVHPNALGAEVYAQLITDALASPAPATYNGEL